MKIKKILFFTLSFINALLPKRENRIVLYGRQMLNDNLEALLMHLIKGEYSKKYKVYCLLADSKPFKKYSVNNIIFEENAIISIYYLFTSKYIFHTHSLSIATFKPQVGQVIFNLWHGSPLKYMGDLNTEDSIMQKSDTYFLTTSDFFIPINKFSYGHNIEQLYVTGNPRNDLLFSKKKVLEMLKIDTNLFSKVIMFMPTFRRSDVISKNDSDIDFPILNKDNIELFNRYLESKNILLIIKPHPYQNSLDFLQKKYSNINIYSNGDLSSADVSLYELLGHVDCLLTDYSSVYFDFLITQKPIGFVLDDYENYSNNRGFVVDNPLDIMPGKKIYSITDLKQFLSDLIVEKDNYIEDRMRVNNLVNKYKDNNNCKRILDFLLITN